MAFKMKGASIIKGTKAHRSAIKKAQTMAYKHDEYTQEQMDQLRDHAINQGHDPKEADQMIHAGNYDLSDIQGETGESPAKILPVIGAVAGMAGRYLLKKGVKHFAKKALKKKAKKLAKGVATVSTVGGGVAGVDYTKKKIQEKKVDKVVDDMNKKKDSPNKFIGKAARGIRKKVARTKGKIKKASGKIKGKVKQASGKIKGRVKEVVRGKVKKAGKVLGKRKAKRAAKRTAKKGMSIMAATAAGKASKGASASAATTKTKKPESKGMSASVSPAKHPGSSMNAIENRAHREQYGKGHDSSVHDTGAPKTKSPAKIAPILGALAVHAGKKIIGKVLSGKKKKKASGTGKTTERKARRAAPEKKKYGISYGKTRK